MPDDASAPPGSGRPAAEPRGPSRLVPRLIALGCILGGTLLGVFAVPAVLARLEPAPAAPEPAPAAKPASSGVALSPILVTVNLAEERGRRYIKAGVVLEAKDDKAKAELERRGVEVRDFLNSLIAEKRLADIESKEKKDCLRREIQLGINERLGLPDAVLHVYFDQFLIE